MHSITSFYTNKTEGYKWLQNFAKGQNKVGISDINKVGKLALKKKTKISFKIKLILWVLNTVLKIKLDSDFKLLLSLHT